MIETNSPPVSVEHFHSSNQSHLGKSRRWMWLSLPLTLVLVAFTSKGSIGTILFTATILFVIYALMEAVFRGKLGDGKPMVTLDDKGLDSPLLPGSSKHLAWSDISSLSLATNQGVKHIQFELTETPERRNQRSFWNGANPARPTLILSPFDAATQESLLQAVHRRLQLSGSPIAGTLGDINKELTEEREFQDKLKALAPTPWLTYALVALNAAIWLLTLSMGGGVTGTSPEKLLTWGGNATSAVQAGEWWRLLSATLLHSGLMHVTMNMIGLIAAGVTVERIYGQRLYAIIYFGSALLGSALSLHFSAQKAVSVGASGAVFGVTGALLIAIFQHRDKLPKAFSKQTVSGLGFFIVYSLIQGFAKTGIDNAAHVGGLLGGCLLAFVLPEKFDLAHFALTARKRAVLALALALGGTAAVAALAPHAAVDLKKLVASRENFALAMDSFNAELKAIQQEEKTMSERELDERGRTIHAPVFRKIIAQFSDVVLPEGDLRQPLLKDIRRTTELMLEMLEMPSNFPEGSDKPQPADPARAAAIEAELKVIGERMLKLSEQLKKPTPARQEAAQARKTIP